MLAKFSGLNPKGPYVSLEKEKQNFCVVVTYSIKRAREIRKFHVAVVQQRLRNVQKSVMHVQRCFFADLNLLFLCCSPSPLQKLPIVVIQKFCYHGNVTLQFPSLCAAAQRGLSNYWKVRSISEKSILEPNLSVTPKVQDLRLIISINHETSYISIPKNKSNRKSTWLLRSVYMVKTSHEKKGHPPSRVTFSRS